jgi:hypothetical protein
MALPLSGQISIRDINEEINSLLPEVQRDLESAGILFDLDVDPNNWSDGNVGLGMDEFYGGSLTDLTVDPTSWTFPNTGGNKDFTVVTRAGNITVVDDRTWLSISNVSNTGFRVTATNNSSVGSPARTGTVTVSNSTTTVDVPISQLSGPSPTIDIDPNIQPVGGLDTFANFDVSTNAPAYTVVSIPPFATSFDIGPLGPTIYFPQNNAAGATTREGNVVVQTDTGIPGVTEVQDTAVLRQAAAAPESITVTPQGDDFTIDAGGENNKLFDVDTEDSYGTQWEALKVSFFGESTDWATINTFYYNNNVSGDGIIDVSFDPNPIGGSIRRVGIQAKKLLSTLEGTAYVTQPANLATLTLTPTDNVSVDINGNGSFTLTSNTSWFIDNSTFPSWIESGDITPATGIAGTYTITINASPRSVGTTTTRQDDITISTDAPGGTNVVRTDYTLIQAANTASITLTPDGGVDNTLELSAGSSNLSFSVSTNADDYSISHPSFITIGFKTINGFVASWERNDTTEDTGRLEVTTITAGTNASDGVDLVRPAAPPEVIDTTPDAISGIPATGQNGYEVDVETEPFYNPTDWVARVEGFDNYPPPSVTFINSSGTNNGTVIFNVNANPDTEQRFGRLVVEKSSDPSIFGVTQLFQDAAANNFTYADAGVSGFSVARNTGQVTAPQASLGTITNRVYSSGYNSGTNKYPLVTSVTQRSVTVTVTVPSGYDNSGQPVSGTETFSQDIADETLSISSAVSSVTNTGQAFAINVVDSPVYSTSWQSVLVSASPSNSSGWITFAGSGTNNGSFTVVVGPNSSGNPGYTGSTRSFSIRVDKVGGGLSSNTLSFTQDVYIPPPPPVEVNLSVSSGCLNGAGFINLSATDENGQSVTNTRYHIDTSAPSSFNNPSTYNGLQNASNLANGTYYVFVWDYDHDIYDFTTTSISCTPTTTTTTTTAAPQSWISERNDGGATGRIGIAQGYSEGNEVLVNDGSGICWTLGTLSTLAPQFSIISVCPPPTTTTTTTTTIGLTSFQGSVNANSFTACSNAILNPRNYQSTSSSGLVSGATIYTGVGALVTNTQYISDGNRYGTTNSSGVFTEVGGCQ